MNLLLDRPPTQIEVGGLFYEIDADFRTSIAFELLMMDEEFTEMEKAARALELYFPQRKSFGFIYADGKIPKRKRTKKRNQRQRTLYIATNTMREASTQRFCRNTGSTLWKSRFCIGGSLRRFSTHWMKT